MHIQCPNCSTETPAENVNLDRMVAKCRRCNAVFGIADQVESAPPSFKRSEVAMPKGITVEHRGYELLISRRWFSATIVFLTVFCLIWDGFLVIWYGVALFSGIGNFASLVFPLIHVVVGVFLTYYVIAGYLNQTLILVSPPDLTIKHKPLPWWGNRHLTTATIGQVYCKQRHHRSKHGNVSYTYQVHCRTREEEDIILLAGLSDPEQALYIEQEIERFLGISDRAVPGEMSR